MTSSNRTRGAREEDLHAVVRLFKDVWGGGLDESSLRSRFRHRYVENPNGNGWNALLVSPGQQGLSGMAGMLDIELAHAGRCLPASFCVDLAVDRAHRGRGIARLLQRRRNARGRLVLVTNINRPGQAVAESTGARKVVDCPVLRRWVRPSDLAGRGRSAPGETREAPETPDARFDTLWDRARQSYPSIAKRDRSTLHWRYSSHPSRRFRFHVFAADDPSEIQGYVVTTLQPWVAGLQRAVIVDLLFSPFDAGQVVDCMRVVQSRMARARAICTDVMASSPDLDRVMRNIGFVDKSRSTSLFVHPSEITEEHPLIWQPASWYLTYGDSDFFL